MEFLALKRLILLCLLTFGCFTRSNTHTIQMRHEDQSTPVIYIKTHKTHKTNKGISLYFNCLSCFMILNNF